MYIADIIWLPQIIDKLSKDKEIPEMDSYEAISDFWDTHSLAVI